MKHLSKKHVQDVTGRVQSMKINLKRWKMKFQWIKITREGIKGENYQGPFYYYSRILKVYPWQSRSIKPHQNFTENFRETHAQREVNYTSVLRSFQLDPARFALISSAKRSTVLCMLAAGARQTSTYIHRADVWFFNYYALEASEYCQALWQITTDYTCCIYRVRLKGKSVRNAIAETATSPVRQTVGSLIDNKWKAQCFDTLVLNNCKDSEDRDPKKICPFHHSDQKTRNMKLGISKTKEEPFL